MNSQTVMFRNLPEIAMKTESNHRYGFDLALHVAKRNTTNPGTGDKPDNARVIPESAFLKLLRTEFKKSFDGTESI